jgi:O-acetyl-ADP-ribose deacetylase (regulator of RNase III)
MIKAMADNGKTFAGIGSRETPGDVADLMRRYAAAACLSGYTLRSGGADGADLAFEDGMRVALEIAKEKGITLAEGNRVYLPWASFRRDLEGMSFTSTVEHPRSIAMVEEHHPMGKSLSRGPMALMRRNCHQVLGDDLRDPVHRIICWTQDGATAGPQTSSKTGGTGMAIRLADIHGVSIYNMRNKEHYDRVENWVERREAKFLERGVDLQAALSAYLEKYNPGAVVFGDIVDLAKAGQLDVVIHNCNCQNAMGSGVAKGIAEAFPGVHAVDRKTVKGDKSKLGTYTVSRELAKNGKQVDFVNLYGQYRYSRRELGEPAMTDLKAIKKGLQSLAVNPMIIGKRVGMPMLGAGLAGADWPAVARLVKEILSPVCEVIVVKYSGEELAPAVEPQNLTLEF